MLAAVEHSLCEIIEGVWDPTVTEVLIMNTGEEDAVLRHGDTVGILFADVAQEPQALLTKGEAQETAGNPLVAHILEDTDMLSTMLKNEVPLQRTMKRCENG